MRRTMTITFATLALVALASMTALFTLAAVAGQRGPCDRPDPAALRQAAEPHYGDRLADLSRCDRTGVGR